MEQRNCRKEVRSLTSKEKKRREKDVSKGGKIRREETESTIDSRTTKEWQTMNETKKGRIIMQVGEMR